jgi:glycine oxidase
MSRTQGAQTYDVAVVGAGVVGLAIAWRALRSGLSVVVVERNRPGAGASGVAAGMLAPVTEADFGEEAKVALNLAGRERWPAFAAELAERSGVDVGYRESGALVLAVDRDDAEELRRLAALQRELHLDAKWLPARECRRLEPGLTPRVRGGIAAPREGHVDPAATVAALRACLEEGGAGVVQGTAVERLETDGTGGVGGVTLAVGRRIEAGAVVLAAGPWSTMVEGLPHAAKLPLRPVKGQVLTLHTPAGRPPLASRLVRTPRCYLVPRTDGRVVVGATMEERGFDTRVTAEGTFRLLEAAREVVPHVDELELVSARAGLRPTMRDNRPAIGRSSVEGLVWATGHGRNGVLLAPLTAEVVVSMLRGEATPVDVGPFDPRRFGAAEGPATRVAAGTEIQHAPGAEPAPATS